MAILLISLIFCLSERLENIDKYSEKVLKLGEKYSCPNNKFQQWAALPSLLTWKVTRSDCFSQNVYKLENLGFASSFFYRFFAYF